uniref:Ig-like domain-containing protein n=1 Tax=Strigamia maritima TaxID=126957 RepID=T1IIK9_STRMM
MCGVSQTVEKTFSIKNNSRRDLDIVWHVNQPFSVEPTSTTIAVDKKFTIKAIFRPRKAAAYTCKAVCTPKNMKNIKHLYYTINFTAQGVYPYLSLVHEKSMDCPNEYEVDFGVVNVNTTSKKEIILVNPLPIKTAFTLTRSEHFLTSNFPFSFEELGGEIAPSGKCPLKALFSPVMPNTEVKDVWNINVNGGFSTKIILLSGKSSGPVVTLSSNIVNFDETERGNIVEKAIKLTNNSTVNTIFQFEIDSKESVFSLEPCIGQITKHSAAVVRIQFKPTYPITYYRRIACIVYMQNPIYLDLLGTAVSSEVQPERLQNWHLETFWDQIRKGQFFFKDENCVLPIVPPKPHPTSVDEYLYDGYHSDFVIIPPPVSLDQNVIDFGRCCHNAYVPTKVFSLTNHTYFVLTITWNGSPANVFSIKPTIVDVQPHRTAVFHLTFKPPGMNQIYSAELEGFAHCTGTGTSALNPGDFNWAPWCLTLTAMGHTYLSARGIYKANYEISSYRVQLPPVPIKSHAARTVLITNKTPTTKIVFNLTSENQDLVVKPRTGVLLKPFAILTIGLTPRLPGPYTTCLHLETNFDKNSIQEIGIEGIASQLLLGLDYSYGLYFKPTCVGVKTERIVVIHNNSPITVNYHWTVKSLYEDVLTVEPLEGVISPHGIQRTRFYFSPQKRIRYTLSVPLTATSEGTFGMIVQKQQEMTVIGEGFSASLKAEPKNLDIGALIVGTLKTEKLMLKNTSYCGLHFKLSIEESGTKLTCKADEGTGRPLCLFLGDKRNDVCAHLPARCDRVIDFKVMPHQHGDYTYKIYYQKLASVDDEESYLSETILLCNIYMNGTHPILQVVEARFLGSATCVRRDRAWELLSLEKLNEYLASEPNYDNKIGQLDESLFPLIDSMQPLNKTVKNIDFHIPPASVGSPPCTLILFLKNPGHVECHWNIWYPWEQKVDVEIWAHTGLYLKTEIDEAACYREKVNFLHSFIHIYIPVTTFCQYAFACTAVLI